MYHNVILKKLSTAKRYKFVSISFFRHSIINPEKCDWNCFLSLIFSWPLYQHEIFVIMSWFFKRKSLKMQPFLSASFGIKAWDFWETFEKICRFKPSIKFQDRGIFELYCIKTWTEPQIPCPKAWRKESLPCKCTKKLCNTKHFAKKEFHNQTIIVWKVKTLFITPHIK